MYKVIYLNDIDFFESFEDLKKYYNFEKAVDLDELNEMLKEVYGAGMATPEIINAEF